MRGVYEDQDSQDERDDDKVCNVDLNGRCQCSSATDALKRDCHACQDDGRSNDIDVKQVAEHMVGDDADLTAKMM